MQQGYCNGCGGTSIANGHCTSCGTPVPNAAAASEAKPRRVRRPGQQASTKRPAAEPPRGRRVRSAQAAPATEQASRVPPADPSEVLARASELGKNPAVLEVFKDLEALALDLAVIFARYQAVLEKAAKLELG